MTTWHPAGRLLFYPIKHLLKFDGRKVALTKFYIDENTIVDGEATICIFENDGFGRMDLDSNPTIAGVRYSLPFQILEGSNRFISDYQL